MTDHDALARYAQHGDPAAFEELVRRYQGLVFAACLRQLRERADVEDAAQETFFKLARQAREVRSNVAAWLHACAVTTSIDLARRRGTRRRHEAQAAQPDTGEHEASEWPEVREALDAAMLELPEEDRELVISHYLQGIEQQALAEERGVSAATISRRLGAALDALRSSLRSRGVGVGAAALAAMLPEAARADVPAALTANLLKVGVSGAGSATMKGAAAVGGATVLTKLAAGVAGAAALVAVGVLWVNDGGSAPPPVPATTAAPKERTGVIIRAPIDARYEDIYLLEDSEDVRLVTTPFITDRLRLYTEKVNPGQVEAIPTGADRMQFRWTPDGVLQNWGSGFGMGADWSWNDVVGSVLELPWYEVRADSRVEALSLEGDWIYREDSTIKERLAAVADIVEEATGTRLTYERQRVTRDVIAATGEFRLNPVGEQREGRATVYLYADSPPGPGEWTRVGGSSRGLLDPRVGRLLGAPILDEGVQMAPFIEWRMEWDLDMDLDPQAPNYVATLDRVLANIERQTGVDLRRQPREMEVWVVRVAEE